MMRIRVTQFADQNWPYFLAIVAGSWIAFSLSGCARQSTGLTEVSGIVTYQGKPLKDGFVSFVPAGDTGSGASGTIGPDGRYELFHSRSLKGIAPGEYQIRIESWEIPPAMGGQPPKHAMPEKYYLVNTSPLRATVEAGRAQTIDLVLED
jgi:hypothetical protein